MTTITPATPPAVMETPFLSDHAGPTFGHDFNQVLNAHLADVNKAGQAAHDTVVPAKFQPLVESMTAASRVAIQASAIATAATSVVGGIKRLVSGS
jgi:hypothetical protein